MSIWSISLLLIINGNLHDAAPLNEHEGQNVENGFYPMQTLTVKSL